MADHHSVHAIPREHDASGRRTRIGCLYVARRRHGHTDAVGGARRKLIMPGQTLLIVVLAILFGLTLVELWDRE